MHASQSWSCASESTQFSCAFVGVNVCPPDDVLDADEVTPVDAPVEPAPPPTKWPPSVPLGSVFAGGVRSVWQPASSENPTASGHIEPIKDRFIRRG
jgi:hypothetical protein